MKKLHITVETLSYLLKERNAYRIVFLGSYIGKTQSDILDIAQKIIDNMPITAPIAWCANEGDIWEINNQDMAIIINLFTENVFFANKSVFLDLESLKLLFENSDFVSETAIKFNEVTLGEIYKKRKIAKLSNAVIENAVNIHKVFDQYTSFAVHYLQCKNRP